MKTRRYFISASAAKTTLPMSRLLSFTPQTRDLRVQCYLHTDQFAHAGFFAKAERQLPSPSPSKAHENRTPVTPRAHRTASRR